MLKSVQRTEEKRLLKYLSFQVRHGLSLEQALQNIGFRKEGAERKEILDDMEKNGVVPQEYMDETIRQNLELKKQLEKAEASMLKINLGVLWELCVEAHPEVYRGMNKKDLSLLKTGFMLGARMRERFANLDQKEKLDSEKYKNLDRG